MFFDFVYFQNPEPVAYSLENALVHRPFPQDDFRRTMVN